jgi:thioredoxin reductase (NADPH)
VAGLLGTQALTGLRLTHVRGGPSRELRCEGVFPFIGVEPDARYLPAAVRLDTQGRIVTDQQLRSSEPSIFAIGDARSGYSGDLVSAAGDAAAAVAAIVADVHA